MKTYRTASSSIYCNDQPLLSQELGSLKAAADFSGGILSSERGLLLLRQVDRALGVSAAVASCFRDGRDVRWVYHSVQQSLAQRLYVMALGYEDLNDHALFRRDPSLAVACEKTDPLGQNANVTAVSDARWFARPRSTGWSCPIINPAGRTSSLTIRRNSKPPC